VNRPFHDERESLYARIASLEHALHARACEHCLARQSRRRSRMLRIGVVTFALFAWGAFFLFASACSSTQAVPAPAHVANPTTAETGALALGRASGLRAC